MVVVFVAVWGLSIAAASAAILAGAFQTQVRAVDVVAIGLIEQ